MKRFNIRVYGLWIQSAAVMVSEELIKGMKILKFPGGGLEWGEGTIDGLKREWREELEADIEVTEHFYTTDFFQKSAWDESQVISIYYLIRPLHTIDLPKDNGIEKCYFLPVNEFLSGQLNLPIDKVVADKLYRYLYPI